MPVAIPGLAVVAAALLALLILWGVKGLTDAIAGLIPSKGAILTAVHNAFVAVAAVAEAAVQWVMADIIDPITNFVLGPVIRFLTWLDAFYSGFKALVSQVYWLTVVALPQLAKRLGAAAARLAAAAEAYAHTLAVNVLHSAYAAVDSLRAALVNTLHAAEASLTNAINAARDYAHTLASNALTSAYAAVAAARTYAFDLVHVLEGTLHSEIARVEGLIQVGTGATVGYVESEVANALKSAETTAIADANKLIGAVDIDVTAAFAKVWVGISDEVDALEGVIATDLPDIGAAVRAIPRAIPLDQVGAIAAIGSIALPLLRYLRECGVPNCRNLSKYGRDLQDLLSAVAVGGMIELFAAMVTDPDGTASEVSDVLGPIARDALDGAKSLLGVG